MGAAQEKKRATTTPTTNSLLFLLLRSLPTARQKPKQRPQRWRCLFGEPPLPWRGAASRRRASFDVFSGFSFASLPSGRGSSFFGNDSGANRSMKQTLFSVFSLSLSLSLSAFLVSSPIRRHEIGGRFSGLGWAKREKEEGGGGRGKKKRRWCLRERTAKGSGEAEREKKFHSLSFFFKPASERRNVFQLVCSNLVRSGFNGVNCTTSPSNKPLCLSD